MRVGKLYSLTPLAKHKRTNPYSPDMFITVYSVDHDNGYHNNFLTYPLDTIVLVLEVTNRNLKNQVIHHLKRVKILLPNGEFGIIYPILSEWEEVI